MPRFTFVPLSKETYDAIDPDRKKLVRQHAAKAVPSLGRRKKKTDSQDSQRRYVKIAPAGVESRQQLDGEATGAVSRALTRLLSPPRNVPSTGYQELRIKYNVDIANLASITDPLVGREACRLLVSEPGTLSKILRQTGSSYLSYLPSRYGSSVCLDRAMQCVASRLSFMTGSTMAESLSERLYGVALRELRKELEAEGRYRDNDVLCAAHLLSLFEMLRSREQAWSQHTAGIAALVKLRGPENHKTDLDVVLLKTKAASIASEAFFLNQKCFLEDEKWDAFFVDLADTSGDLDAAFWTVYRAACRIPSLIADTAKLLRRPPDTYAKYLRGRIAILKRAKEVRHILMSWHEGDALRSLQYATFCEAPTTSEPEFVISIRGMFTHGLMIANRIMTLFTALDQPEYAAGLERETQTWARVAEMTEKLASVAPSDSWQPSTTHAHHPMVIKTGADWPPKVDKEADWRDQVATLRDTWGRYAACWEIYQCGVCFYVRLP